MLAFAFDYLGTDNVMEIWMGGIPTGLYLTDDGLSGDIAPQDGLFGWELKDVVFPQGAQGRYLLEVATLRYGGSYGPPWPYLNVE